MVRRLYISVLFSQSNQHGCFHIQVAIIQAFRNGRDIRCPPCPAVARNSPFVLEVSQAREQQFAVDQGEDLFDYKGELSDGVQDQEDLMRQPLHNFMPTIPPLVMHHVRAKDEDVEEFGQDPFDGIIVTDDHETTSCAPPDYLIMNNPAVTIVSAPPNDPSRNNLHFLAVAANEVHCFLRYVCLVFRIDL